MFYQLIYVSQATAPLSGVALKELIAKARTFNSLHHITGVLFYDGGHFAQVLEGAQAEVDYLFARIQRDARHQHVTVVTRSFRARREYPHWGMAGHIVAATEFAELIKCLPEENLSLSEPLRNRLEPFVTRSQRV